jgi:hypothetical protein
MAQPRAAALSFKDGARFFFAQHRHTESAIFRGWHSPAILEDGVAALSFKDGVRWFWTAPPSESLDCSRDGDKRLESRKARVRAKSIAGLPFRRRARRDRRGHRKSLHPRSSSLVVASRAPSVGRRSRRTVGRSSKSWCDFHESARPPLPRSWATSSALRIPDGGDIVNNFYRVFLKSV